MPNPRRSDTRGSVLLFCLWATAALTAVGITQASRIALQARWLDRVQEERQAGWLAYSGVQAAVAVLATDDPAVDGYHEVWARTSSEPYRLETGSFFYTIQDEQARLPINALPKELLSLLPGFNPQMAEAVIQNRLGGHPLVHLGQLRFFGPLTPEAMEELSSLVTVQGTGPVNLNTASQNVLFRLGLPATLVNQILLYRSGPDAMPGTADDRSFQQADAASIGTVLAEAVGYHLSPEDQTALNGLTGGGVPLLGIQTLLFRVEARGITQPHGIEKKVWTVMSRQGNLRGWHEA